MTTDELISKIKEKIYSGNRGTCDYFIVDEIEDLIYEYEESGGCAKCNDHSEPKRESKRWKRLMNYLAELQNEHSPGCSYEDSDGKIWNFLMCLIDDLSYWEDDDE